MMFLREYINFPYCKDLPWGNVAGHCLGASPLVGDRATTDAGTRRALLKAYGALRKFVETIQWHRKGGRTGRKMVAKPHTTTFLLRRY